MKYKQAHIAHGIHGILNERAHSIMGRNKQKQTQIQYKDAYHNGAIKYVGKGTQTRLEIPVFMYL